jgi:hypothetical protein
VAWGAAIGVAVILGIAALLVVTVAGRPATATPAYTQQTGHGCADCHIMPPTGDKLTPFGQDFAKNRTKK